MTPPVPIPNLNFNGGNSGPIRSKTAQDVAFKSGNTYNLPPDWKTPAIILAISIVAYAYITRS